MPIILQVEPSDAKAFGVGDRVALCGKDGTVHALLDVGEIFTPDIETMSRKWFGTSSADHPGVQRFLAGGKCCLAGKVWQVERIASDWRKHYLSPAQCRFLFSHKGWSRVVGFHTRNPAHRVHEFIQMEAMRRAGADGLLISPVIGPKKAGDFLPGPIMKSYQALLDFGIYPEGAVTLGVFPTYSRYCGPREAVFTALCRKNMGCSHFIIGRDHTGVGQYYAKDTNRRIFDAIGDIGIEPVFFDTVGYDPEAQRYVERENDAGLVSISGTEVRERIRLGKPLPHWFTREIVQEVLQREIAEGKSIFVDPRPA